VNGFLLWVFHHAMTVGLWIYLVVSFVDFSWRRTHEHFPDYMLALSLIVLPRKSFWWTSNLHISIL